MSLAELIDYINNGISKNGVVREFDILDYYIQSKGLSPNYYIEKIDNNISLDNIRKIKRFFGANKIGETLSDYYIRCIMETDDYVNTKRNKEGELIPGTGRIITTDEKKGVINYLLNNNIPLTTKLYSIAIKRYVDGELDIELNQSKSL